MQMEQGHAGHAGSWKPTASVKRLRDSLYSAGRRPKETSYSRCWDVSRRPDGIESGEKGWRTYRRKMIKDPIHTLPERG